MKKKLPRKRLVKHQSRRKARKTKNPVSMQEIPHDVMRQIANDAIGHIIMRRLGIDWLGLIGRLEKSDPEPHPTNPETP